MLTETTRAHGRVTRHIAERDGGLLQWHVSPRHRDRDTCDANAKRENGFGAGIYRVAEFPELPQHPRCRCWSSTVEVPA